MTNGQIAYEGYFKACVQDIPFPWGEMTPEQQRVWEAAAQAVLAAQWKSASEPPDSQRNVIIEQEAWYESHCKVWYDNGEVKRWHELPTLPEA